MEMNTSPLTTAEQKQIRRYYRYTRWATPMLAAALLSALLCILLSMIDAIFLESESPHLFGYKIGIATMVVFSLAFLYMFAVSIWGMSGKNTRPS